MTAKPYSVAPQAGAFSWPSAQWCVCVYLHKAWVCDEQSSSNLF